MKYKWAAVFLSFLFIAGSALLFSSDDAEGTDVSSISGDTTWTSSGSPYIIQNNVNVAAGTTLTINAGVEVRFKGPAGLPIIMTVQGAIYAQGTESQPIVFKSDKVPAQPWAGIHILGTGSYLDNCEFHDSIEGLHFNGADTFTVSNSTFYTQPKPVLVDACDWATIKFNEHMTDKIGFMVNDSFDILLQENTGSVHIKECHDVEVWGQIVDQSTSDKPAVLIDNSNFINFNYGDIVSGSNAGMVIGDNTQNCVVRNNTIKDCLQHLVCKPSSQNNRIFHNNFLGTAIDVQDLSSGKNDWSFEKEGNYWADFQGEDNGKSQRPRGDLISDINLTAKGLDNWPYLKEWGWLYPVLVDFESPSEDHNLVTSRDYVINCTKGKRVDEYVLEESINFTTHSITIYSPTSPRSFEFTGKIEGDIQYRLRGKNAIFDGEYSRIITITVDLPPQPVKGLKAKPSAKGNAVNLSWTGNSENDLKGYSVECNATGEWVLVGNTSRLWLEHDGLSNGKTYHYRVFAYDQNDVRSEPVFDSAVPDDSEPPAAVENLEARTVSRSSIELSWDIPDDDSLDHFEIFSGLSGVPAELSKLNSSIPSDQKVFTDKDLLDGKEYFYAIIAVDMSGNPSALSDIVSNTTFLGQRPPDIVDPPSKVTMDEDTPYNFFLGEIFVDPNQDPLIYDWKLANGTDGKVSIDITNGLARITTDANWFGDVDIEFLAQDQFSDPVSFVTNLVVQSVNDDPQVVIVLPNDGQEFGFDQKVDLICEGSDIDLELDDNERLLYEWSSNLTTDVWYEVSSNRTLPPGHHLITVVVRDNYGARSSASVTIYVKPEEKSDDDVDDDVGSDDTDQDGLLDEWEKRYWGDLRWGPSDDPDGDGMNNQQEFQNGLDPTKKDAPDTDDDDDDNSLGMLPIIIGVLAVIAVIVIILVVVFVLMKGKQEEEPEEEAIVPEIVEAEKKEPEVPVQAKRMGSKKENEPKKTAPKKEKPRPNDDEVETWVTDSGEAPGLDMIEEPEFEEPEMPEVPDIDDEPPMAADDKKLELDLDPYHSELEPPNMMDKDLAKKGSSVMLALPPAVILEPGSDGIDVDEVFVINAVSGLLINHYSAKTAVEIDEDILTGMLQAVQSFVADSFKAKNSALKELKLGDFTILIEKGDYVTVVAFTSKGKPKVIKPQIKYLIMEIEESYDTILEDWNGDIGQLAGIQDFVFKFLNGDYIDV